MNFSHDMPTSIPYLKNISHCIGQKFTKIGHIFFDADTDIQRTEEKLWRHDTIYVPEKYREITSNASRKNLMTYIRKTWVIQWTKIKNELLTEKVRFRDGLKWIRVEEYGSYIYKKLYEKVMPLKKITIWKIKW